MASSGGANSAATIEVEFEKNKQSVVELLIRNCMQVDTSIPRVVKGKFGDDVWAVSSSLYDFWFDSLLDKVHSAAEARSLI